MLISSKIYLYLIRINSFIFLKSTFTFILILSLCSLIYKPVIQVSSTLTLSQKVIVIDPGHGGLDNGASVGKVNEDELNLKICLKNFLMDLSMLERF